MSTVAVTSRDATAGKCDPVRVMVVDDSAVIRGLIGRWIDAEDDLSVVASLRTGREALNQLERADPDVVVLDIEMPDLDGLAALPLLLAKKRDLVVIMASTLTRRNAEISFKALALGASDYIPKPESNRELLGADVFRHDLVQKIRHLVPRHRVPKHSSPPIAPRESRDGTLKPALYGAREKITIRPLSRIVPKVLLVGSSTGGPQALMKLVSGIGPVIDRVPVLITQHMPPTFTTILAEHLARASGRAAHEAVDGEPIKPGCLYLAPGGKHMRVMKAAPHAVIALGDDPPINYCKPAVDPLFVSAVDAWHGAIMAIVLTGMGSDGARGGKAIVEAGGNVVAQDEATSVVWGMPGAAAHAGICAAVLPLGDIAPSIVRVFSGDRL